MNLNLKFAIPQFFDIFGHDLHGNRGPTATSKYIWKSFNYYCTFNVFYRTVCRCSKASYMFDNFAIFELSKKQQIK